MLPQKTLSNEHKTLNDLPRARHKMLKVTVLGICGIVSILMSIKLTLWDSFTGRAMTSDSDDFDWKKINPSPKLHWVSCYSGTECARLEVPLDYSDPDGHKAAVALVRFKANVPSGSEEYRGPVLFNPGGPGGSGVTLIKERGERFHQLLGGVYDIIGFDPRGIGETTPTVSIFPDDIERGYWDAGTPPLLNSTPDALPRALSRAKLFNQLVNSRSKRAAQHASTAVVARDMLSITKAHGRDRLQYWGFSYGTVLGATYAAMFPENIERMIIDGVVDFDDYYAGKWSKNLLDTDKALQFIYNKCAESQACPLHANSSSLVQKRVETLFASLKVDPVAAENDSDYGLIDVLVAKTSLLNALYKPFQMIPPLFQAFSALERGDGRPALAIWRKVQKMPKCDKSRPAERLEGGLAVMCGEGAATNTLPHITRHFEKLSKMSIFADIWTDIARTSCSNWKVRPKEIFSGPFMTNTSFPLLVIGNTADPVTPLVGAQKAAHNFGNSALLTVNTPGHCSPAGTSLCVNKIIRRYFTKGKLPTKGTVCEVEDILFEEPSVAAMNITSEDERLLTLTRSLSRDFERSRSPLHL